MHIPMMMQVEPELSELSTPQKRGARPARAELRGQGLLRALCWCPGLEAGRRLELLSLLLDDVNQPHRRDSQPNGHTPPTQHAPDAHHASSGSGQPAVSKVSMAAAAPPSPSPSPSSPPSSSSSSSPPCPPPSVDVDDVDPRDGCTVLHRLLAAGTLPVSRGVDPAQRRGAEQATLAVAATLLQGGARVNVRSLTLNTPLHVACASPGTRLPMLRLLTQARADVNAANGRAETPLHLLALNSARFEATQAVAHVLEGGGRIGARDERGDTPLHKAVMCSNLPLACQLVGAGASLAVTNGAGRTVLDLVSGGQSVVGSQAAARLLEAITLPPLWVPDEAAHACMLCRAPFTTRLRVHHCRHCGAAVCSGCSPKKLPLPKFNERKPVRTCSACHAVLAAAAAPVETLRLSTAHAAEAARAEHEAAARAEFAAATAAAAAAAGGGGIGGGGIGGGGFGADRSTASTFLSRDPSNLSMASSADLMSPAASEAMPLLSAALLLGDSAPATTLPSRADSPAVPGAASSSASPSLHDSPNLSDMRLRAPPGGTMAAMVTTMPDQPPVKPRAPQPKLAPSGHAAWVIPPHGS